MNKREAERRTIQDDRLRALGFTRDECEALRRISMTLRRWYELECGDGNDYASWAIERDENDELPYMVRHIYPRNGGKTITTRTRIADREKGAIKRLDKILAERGTRLGLLPGDRNWICDNGTIDICNSDGDVRLENLPKEQAVLSYYLQTDPRGAALYIIRPGDVPEGKDVSAYYPNGLCVY